MDGIFKIILVWVLTQYVCQTPDTCCDATLSSSPTTVRGDESGAPARHSATSRLHTPQVKRENKCSKWSMDAWIDNQYMLAFWRASEYCGRFCRCPLDDMYTNDEHHNMYKNSFVPLNILTAEILATPYSYSSVWCHSSPESGLQCRFQNLYYNLPQREFVFLHSLNSTIYGIESIKSLQEHLFISSVIGHNAFQIPITVLPLSSFAAKYQAQVISGTSLLMSRFKPDNLLHVFHDDLLPIFFTMEDICLGVWSCIEENNVLLFDEYDRSIYWHLYSSLYKRTVLISELAVLSMHTWFSFETAYVGLNKMSVWYQYGFGRVQGPKVQKTFTGYHLRRFTEFVKQKLKISHLPPSQHAGILLSRRLNRKILNENEVMFAMKEQLKSVSGRVDSLIKILYLEKYDLSTVISELSHARLAVGVHGAALILAMFLPPGSLLVELWPFGISHTAATVYKTMCKLRHFDVIYIPWSNEDPENTKYHPEYLRFYGGLNGLSVTEQENMIRGLYANKLESLECCDSTNWLFRIYQDTHVRVSENDVGYKSVPLSSILREGLQYGEDYRVSSSENKNIIRNQIYPSKVQELHCQLIRNDTFVNLFLEWKDPWNIENIDCKNIGFEILVQVVGDNNAAERNVVRDRRFSKTLAMQTNAVNIWVTCLCNDVEGTVLYKLCVL